MPVGLVTIEKEVNGRTWENSYGVAVTNFDSRIASNAQIAAIVGALVLGADLDDQTNPGLPEYVNAATGASILAAIIAFERLMTFQQVRFLRAYISDGKTKARGIPGPSGVFASIPLAGNGLRSSTGIRPAPLPIVLGISRVAAGFSQRNGLLMLRMAIDTADVTFGDDDGVDFGSEAIALNYADRVQIAMSQSVLDNATGEIVTGTWNDTRLAIPKYATANDELPEGAVKGGAPVANFVSLEPLNRQITRGRRRSV